MEEGRGHGGGQRSWRDRVERSWRTAEVMEGQGGEVMEFTRSITIFSYSVDVHGCFITEIYFLYDRK
jgi:hypothetical protein